MAKDMLTACQHSHPSLTARAEVINRRFPLVSQRSMVGLPQSPLGGALEEQWDRMSVGVEDRIRLLLLQEITERTTNRWSNPTYHMIMAFHSSPSHMN